MPEEKPKRGRPPTELAKARLAKEQALAALRLQQVRERQKQWNDVVNATLSAALIVIKDRLRAIPDRLQSLTPEQREALRREIHEALEAWSKAEF